MTTILAIDTSTDACSVAIHTTTGIQQVLSVSPREHTQRLLPMVEGLLADHQLLLSQCDAIALTVGPGSFTGLRIGLSTAQGLAYGADLPLIPVSTLKALAQTALRTKTLDVDSVILPVIDARMDEVYWAAYGIESEHSQSVVTLVDDGMCQPDDVAIAEAIEQPRVVGVGSGWKYQTLQSRFPLQYDIDCYPQAYDVASIAEQDYQHGVRYSPLELTPTYLRNEISWQKRQRIRSHSNFSTIAPLQQPELQQRSQAYSDQEQQQQQKKQTPGKQ